MKNNFKECHLYIAALTYVIVQTHSFNMFNAPVSVYLYCMLLCRSCGIYIYVVSVLTDARPTDRRNESIDLHHRRATAN